MKSNWKTRKEADNNKGSEYYELIYSVPDVQNRNKKNNSKPITEKRQFYPDYWQRIQKGYDITSYHTSSIWYRVYWYVITKHVILIKRYSCEVSSKTNTTIDCISVAVMKEKNYRQNYR